LTTSEQGFTLLELIVVVVLLGFLSGVFLTRFESLLPWRQKEELRTFLNTWEFVYREALAKGEAYRLVLDLDRNSYAVLREVPLDRSTVRQVDYLKNLRTRGEQRRREQEEQLVSTEEEFKQEDERDAGSLEYLFFDFAYQDPFGNVRLSRPTEFPNLAEPKQLPESVVLSDVVFRSELIEKGKVNVRFSSRGASDFVVVHFRVASEPYTAVMNPSTGELKLDSGYLDYDWSHGRDQGRHS
jgi:prepilin-type N-terminal cleavage/methylation domain-containing protein